MVDMDQLLDKQAQGEVLKSSPPLQVALRPLPPSNLLRVLIRQLHGFQLRLALTSTLDPLAILLFIRVYGRTLEIDGRLLPFLRASRVMITTCWIPSMDARSWC